jgi:polyisoprenoid-binding protein YceI
MNIPARLAALALLVPVPAVADCWLADAAGSEVRFEATQAGAPIEGSFHEFTGRICLDDAEAAQSSIEVSINTASVDMGLPEFDEAMRGAEFFDVARWPTAHFASTAVKSLLGAGRYEVTGRFTIRDRTKDVEVPFTLTTNNGAAMVAGEMTLKRLDYDIGLGQWQDTRWVGNEVVLRFTVALKPERPTEQSP